MNIQVLFPWTACSLGKGLSSVDLSSCCLDSNLLLLVVRLVVSGQNSDLSTGVDGHDSPRVSDVDDVDHVVDDHDHVGAGSGSLRTHILPCDHILSSLLGLLN